MVRIGIDVAILSLAGLVFLIIGAIVCYLRAIEQDKANVILVTIASVSGAMVVGYTIMARILDSML